MNDIVSENGCSSPYNTGIDSPYSKLKYRGHQDKKLVQGIAKTCG